MDLIKKPTVYIIIYSLYHHVYTMAKEVQKGLELEGVNVEIFQVPETLSDEILVKLHAPEKPELPVISVADLANADAFLFGIPTRFGSFPSQLKSFLDATGGLWAKGTLAGKFAGAFFSTATQHGGQETTVYTLLPYLAHHGLNYIPLGFADANLNDNSEVVGGSPYGSGTIANGDGSRLPSEKEFSIARTQGQNFAKILNSFHRGLELTETPKEEDSKIETQVNDAAEKEIKDEVKTEELKEEEAKVEEVKEEEIKTEEVKVEDEIKTEEVKVDDEIKTEEVKVDDEIKTEEVKIEEEIKAVETKAEEQIKTVETKVEEQAETAGVKAEEEIKAIETKAEEEIKAVEAIVEEATKTVSVPEVAIPEVSVPEVSTTNADLNANITAAASAVDSATGTTVASTVAAAVTASAVGGIIANQVLSEKSEESSTKKAEPVQGQETVVKAAEPVQTEQAQASQIIEQFMKEVDPVQIDESFIKDIKPFEIHEDLVKKTENVEPSVAVEAVKTAVKPSTEDVKSLASIPHRNTSALEDKKESSKCFCM